MNETPKKLSLKSTTSEAAPKLEERIQKVLAQAGLGSRRSLEQRIADGMVKVNGEVAQIGQSVKSGDKIEIDGRHFVCSALNEPTRVLVYNKPEGEVTTREDPEGRPTVFEALPSLKGARWISIGRLDINTTGLLVLTTDGELANGMMHPSYEVEREYVCRVRPPEGEDHVPENLIDRLRRGVSLDDGPAKFERVEAIGGTDSHDWYQVVVKEGRNREVRRLWESQGCQVSRLKRVRYGNISLPRELRRGHSVELPVEQVKALRESLGLEDAQPSALTLQSVIGQRKATKSVIKFENEGRPRSRATAEEANELRRFDNFRDERGGGRGRGGPRGGGRANTGLTVSGDAAAKQSNKPFKQRREKGPKLPEGSPASFRSWYVPDGVETGPRGGAAGKPSGGRGPGRGGPGGPRGAAGPGGGQRRGGPGAGAPRRDNAGSPYGNKSSGGGNRSASPRLPYGHPDSAPTFPSDYASGGGNPNSPYGAPKRNAGRGDNRGPGRGGPRGGAGKPGGGNRGPGRGGPRGGGGGNRGPYGGR